MAAQRGDDRREVQHLSDSQSCRLGCDHGQLDPGAGGIRRNRGLPGDQGGRVGRTRGPGAEPGRLFFWYALDGAVESAALLRDTACRTAYDHHEAGSASCWRDGGG